MKRAEYRHLKREVKSLAADLLEAAARRKPQLGVSDSEVASEEEVDQVAREVVRDLRGDPRP